MKLIYKYFLTCILIFGTTLSYSQDLVHYVQPMAGTATATTAGALKHGSVLANFANTIPSVTVPFAMTQWTPQTQQGENKCVPPYYDKDDHFSGLRGTHWISGSCMQDYGSVTVMPITGHLKTSNYAASFSHSEEIASPDFYQINLKQYGLKAAVTATKRCGIMQFTMDMADSLYLLITPNDNYHEGFIKVDVKKGEIYGYNPVHRIYQGWVKALGSADIL